GVIPVGEIVPVLVAAENIVGKPDDVIELVGRPGVEHDAMLARQLVEPVVAGVAGRLEAAGRWRGWVLAAGPAERGQRRERREEGSSQHHDCRFCGSASISSSVSTSRTSEYGFSISRVRGRARSISADSDGTPEKMMIGTPSGAAPTTSRPEPRFRRRSTTAATKR